MLFNRRLSVTSDRNQVRDHARRRQTKRAAAHLSLAFFSLVIVLTFCPTNASATVNCQEVYPTETTYPEGPYSFYCGTASIANATQMVTAATQTHGTATGEVRRANGGVVFYLFHNPYEYKQNFPQSQGYPAPGLTDFGVFVPRSSEHTGLRRHF